jgi:hypothetical protein
MQAEPEKSGSSALPPPSQCLCLFELETTHKGVFIPIWPHYGRERSGCHLESLDMDTLMVEKEHYWGKGRDGASARELSGNRLLSMGSPLLDR